MLTRILVILVMLAIVLSLGSALYFLVHDNSDSPRTVKALTWRIVISLSLFIFLFLAFSLGWISPHGI